MSDDTQQPIVVKRIKKGGGGHHGGAWKIAYADFVTAMMAFFLLMWLLGSTTQGDLKGISEYFSTPLKVAMAGGSGSGDSSSVIQGGGEDLSRAHGQVKKGDIESEKRSLNLQALRADFERQERARLEGLKGDLEQMIDSTPTLRQFKSQLLLDLTSEGLRIQIVDEKNRPMFDSASSELKPYTKEILHEIGRALNRVDNRISLSGHTDATPYSGGDKGFGNWELSTNRANASRREMIAGGMRENKVMRIVGLASTILYDKQDPYNPTNRRISIVVMNKRTEEAILRDGNNTDIGDEGDAGQQVEQAASRLPAASTPAAR
ncbi:MAG: flagellar motor protein MotB [Proteobacteria bacterium]|nr:flagellar motor protein MotB [Pseudomonadota bacterium]HQR05100.1 flagellar motor protein MotB [Rhodocyclaceae bacterium]